jgi:glycosyltransferase involved in cell wall biosynthesis
MKRICFLTGEYPPMQGGIGDYTSLLAQNLRALGEPCEILIDSRWKMKMAQAALSDAAATIPVYPEVTAWDGRCWLQVRKFLERKKPDILHIQYQAAAYDLMGWVNWLPWFLKRVSSKVPVITTFHDLRVPYIFPKAGDFRRQSILAMARWSDGVITTNAEDEYRLREDLASRRREGQCSPIITRIPLGLNLQASPPAGYDRRIQRRKLGGDERTIFIAYFGLLNESKGAEELVEVLAQLWARGYNAKLLMVGGTAGDADPTNKAFGAYLEGRIRALNLADKIIWTGFLAPEEVSACLLAADIALLPYRDGVSFRRTSLITILAHGLPVISTEPSITLPELLPEDNILLVPPGDVPAMLEATLRLSGNEALKTRLADGARAMARHFSWEIVGRQTFEFYESLEKH